MAGNPQDHIGPYEIRGKLGEGAMAIVWRGYDPHLEREVAIKEPKFGKGDSQERIEELGARFVKEGKTAAKLDHGNIVTIYAADVYDGRPAIVMELVNGRTLFDVLKHGALSPEVALDIADQLLDAVACAHDKGIVHRDIKPDNIFIDAYGTVKLADFGIAHIEDGSATHATMAGTVLGAPGYMSPEQAVGDPVDSRSDIFSIGVVIYEMLTGENPFRRGDNANATTVLYRTVHEPVPELPESACEGLPVDLRPAVESALAKKPDDRPQSARDFKAELHGAPVPTRPLKTVPRPISPSDSPSQPQPKGPTKNYLPFILGGVAGVAVILLLIVFAVGSSSGGGGTTGGTDNTTTSTTDTGTGTDDSKTTKDSKDGKETTGKDKDAGKKSYDESKVTDSKGFITLYGCSELDGAELSKIFEKYDYDQITDEGVTMFTFDNKNYGLFVSTGSDDNYIGFSDVEKLKAGGEGTPILYKILTKQYKTTADAIKGLGCVEIEKQATNANGVECGIVKNSNGKRYLFACVLTDNGVIDMRLYNEDALAKGFLPNRGTTIDEAYNALMSD